MLNLAIPYSRIQCMLQRINRWNSLIIYRKKIAETCPANPTTLHLLTGYCEHSKIYVMEIEKQFEKKNSQKLR